MNKTIIKIPKGIRYINEWDGFALPNEVCIIDKQITGCGFTEYCLTSNDNVILVSPRKILLENKEEQHKGEVFYAKSELDQIIDFEKDFTGKAYTKDILKDSIDIEKIKHIMEGFKVEIKLYSDSCYTNHIPCKILVTYDSFRHVKEALGNNIENFYIVVDEFQSIFVDAKFKSSTEIEFLQHLQGLSKITFVSATPMMDKYLNMLDEFKNLPYYELDWKSLDPSRVTKPKLQVRTYNRGMYEPISEIIEKYKTGRFESSFRNINGIIEEVQSKEAVFYVNSVKALCTIIRKNTLTLENTNILCAKNPSNEKDIRSAFNDSYKKLYPGDRSKLIPKISPVIGKVPTKGEPHKMFTLCTRTVYLGADFYSTNARSFIFSDANVDSLSVDVSMDLEQILGRQRLDENPWKNSADLYIKTSLNKMTEEEFKQELYRKKQITENLLGAYNTCADSGKHDLAKKYQKDAKVSNYKDDYVAVNEHVGKDLIPVFNNLMLVAEQRTFEVQQLDYRDRFTIFNTLGNVCEITNDDVVLGYLNDFECKKNFQDKMKKIEEVYRSVGIESFNLFVSYLPIEFINIINTLDFSEIRACGYQRSKIIKRLSDKSTTKESIDNIRLEIINSFLVGEKYSKVYIKDTLKSIYESNGYNQTPRAIDLDSYFELKDAKVPNKITGKRDNGYEIIKIKTE